MARWEGVVVRVDRCTTWVFSVVGRLFIEGASVDNSGDTVRLAVS